MSKQKISKKWSRSLFSVVHSCPFRNLAPRPLVVQEALDGFYDAIPGEAPDGPDKVNVFISKLKPCAKTEMSTRVDVTALAAQQLRQNKMDRQSQKNINKHFKFANKKQF